MEKLKVIKNSTFKDNRGFLLDYMEKGQHLKFLNLIIDKFSISKKKF